MGVGAPECLAFQFHFQRPNSRFHCSGVRSSTPVPPIVGCVSVFAMGAGICPLGYVDELFVEILAFEHAKKGGWRFSIPLAIDLHHLSLPDVARSIS